jgi:hypothetical protein
MSAGFQHSDFAKNVDSADSHLLHATSKPTSGGRNVTLRPRLRLR